MESSNKWYEKVPVQKEGENAMSEAMLALLGFATIIIVIALLLRNVTVPALAFVSVSTVTGAILVATGTFTIEEMGEFVTAGVAGVHGTASLFIFSVLFFGIMTDVGMFDKIINALMKKVGSNVVGVAMMTCIIAMIGHLDGGLYIPDHNSGNAPGLQTSEYETDNSDAHLCICNGCNEPSAMGRTDNACGYCPWN